MANARVRRERILAVLRAQGFCSVAALAEELRVTEATIRNDLNGLEAEGTVTRLHGGATLATAQPLSSRFEEHTHVNERFKRQIARFAAGMVEDYDRIMLDASTTAYYMSEYLSGHQGLTVFTNGIEVALRLVGNPTNKVVLTGGVLRRENLSMGAQFGGGVLHGVRANKAFLSCSGWSAALEPMEDDLFELQMKQIMTDGVEQVILLSDSTKFARKGLASFAPVKRIGKVITDDEIEDRYLAGLRRAGVSVTICGADSASSIEGERSRPHVRIGFANQLDTAAYPRQVRQGLLEAAVIHNIELLLADNRDSGVIALANLEYFIKEKVDLVVEYITDAHYGNIIMERLKAESIPTIAIDIPLPGATFVGIDNYRAGLMAGTLIGRYAMDRWQGRVDKVISLEQPLSGPIPASRVQGQIAGFRDLIPVNDEDIIRLDCQNTYAGAYHVIADILPALQSDRHIAVLSIHDNAALGAFQAFDEAHAADRMITVCIGADQLAVKELQRTDSPIIGAVTCFPGHYGDLIISAALNILQSKHVPPALYTDHILVLPEKIIQSIDLSALPFDFVSAADYADSVKNTKNLISPHP